MIPKNLTMGWKVVQPDGRTYKDFRWPLVSGAKVVAANPKKHNDPCPTALGDGLCVAKTWSGAASGGYAAITGLLLGYRPQDVLAESTEKLRVGQCWVLAVIDIQRDIREGRFSGADLSGAYLSRADLSRANLSGADLYGANLSRANRGADAPPGWALDATGRLVRDK